MASLRWMSVIGSGGIVPAGLVFLETRSTLASEGQGSTGDRQALTLWTAVFPWDNGDGESCMQCRESTFLIVHTASRCLKQILVSPCTIVVYRNPRKSIRELCINHAQKADEGPKISEWRGDSRGLDNPYKCVVSDGDWLVLVNKGPSPSTRGSVSFCGAGTDHDD